MTTRSERIEEIETEIAEINTALSNIRKAGQSFMIMSASGAGTQRTVTQADYDKLKQHKTELQQELNSLQGRKGFRVGASW